MKQYKNKHPQFCMLPVAIFLYIRHPKQAEVAQLVEH